MLDLDQRALVGRVRVAESLGDDAVEAGAFELGEPVVGRRQRRSSTGTGTPAARRPRVAASASMTLTERTIEQCVVVECQQVEGDERGRRLGGQPAHPRLGRVDALQQRVEVETTVVVGRDDDLAVDDAAMPAAMPATVPTTRGSTA